MIQVSDVFIHYRTALASSITPYNSTLWWCEDTTRICQKWFCHALEYSLDFGSPKGGIAAASAMALILAFHACRTRDCHQNWLSARRQPLSGLQDAPDAVRPPESPLPAAARIRRAHRRNHSAGAFLRMYAEPVQSNRSNDGGLREQKREESGIR